MSRGVDRRDYSGDIFHKIELPSSKAASKRRASAGAQHVGAGEIDGRDDL